MARPEKDPRDPRVIDDEEQAREGIVDAVLTAPPEKLAGLGKAIHKVITGKSGGPSDVLEWFRNQKSSTPEHHQYDPWND